MRRNTARNPRSGRRIWTPRAAGGGGGCTPLVESWPDAAGAITRPEWVAPYGPGTELVATGTGEATGNGVVAVGLRSLDGHYSIAATVTTDEASDVSLVFYDVGDSANNVQAGWAAAGPSWAGGLTSLPDVSAASGATQALLIQWNATNWSVTIGAEAPIVGVFPGALVGPFSCLVALFGAGGDNLVDEITFGCTALS